MGWSPAFGRDMSRSSDRVAVFRRLRAVDGFDNRITYLEENGVSGGAGGHVASVPVGSADMIANMYYDPVESIVYIDVDDLADPLAYVLSSPPVGSFPVVNMYYEGGTTFIQYDNEVV